MLSMVDVPIPTTCADDEVLVRISHVALNSAMVYRLMANRTVFDLVGALTSRPCVPEMDFSGVVCDLKGANVQDLHTGDRVFGVSPPQIGNIANGVLREYLLIKRDLLATVPQHVSLRDAASFPATGLHRYRLRLPAQPAVSLG